MVSSMLAEETLCKPNTALCSLAVEAYGPATAPFHSSVNAVSSADHPAQRSGVDPLSAMLPLPAA